MREQPTKTDPVLLQMVGTLAELKQGQQQTAAQLGAIQTDIRKFDVGLAEMRKDMEQAQSDISNRTHREETNRIKVRVEEVQNMLQQKASAKIMHWILGLVGSMFMAMLSIGVKFVFFP